MIKQFKKYEFYETLINEVEEAILVWQIKQKQIQKDKKFNAKKYLGAVLGYKDEHIIYRFLDPNNSASAKFGIEDLQKILMEIEDLTPLKNFVESLELESKGKE